MGNLEDPNSGFNLFCMYLIYFILVEGKKYSFRRTPHLFGIYVLVFFLNKKQYCLKVVTN